jgi:two-component system sensor histidine kinase/response regulator
MTHSDDSEVMTLMIVEDDPAIRDVIKTMCELWNFEVIAFRDGYQAVEYLEKDPSPPPVPKVALLDIRMPGPWGHEISSKIRQHPTLGNIGIVLMTAYELPGSDEKQMIKTSGADRLIYKPLPAMDELLNMVQEVIRERKSLETLSEAQQPPGAEAKTKPQIKSQVQPDSTSED